MNWGNLTCPSTKRPGVQITLTRAQFYSSVPPKWDLAIIASVMWFRCYLLDVPNHLSAGTFWHPTTVWVSGCYTRPECDKHREHQPSHIVSRCKVPYYLGIHPLPLCPMRASWKEIISRAKTKLTSCIVHVGHSVTVALWPHRRWKRPTKHDFCHLSAYQWCVCPPHHQCCT